MMDTVAVQVVKRDQSNWPEVVDLNINDGVSIRFYRIKEDYLRRRIHDVLEENQRLVDARRAIETKWRAMHAPALQVYDHVARALMDHALWPGAFDNDVGSWNGHSEEKEAWKAKAHAAVDAFLSCFVDDPQKPAGGNPAIASDCTPMQTGQK